MSFLLLNFAEVHGLNAFFVGSVVALLASVVLEVAFSKWNSLAGLGALSLVHGTVFVLDALWFGGVP